MNVIITHYKKADNGIDTVYHNGKPVQQVTTAKLPLKFGYGSYNEPKKILSHGINVDDVISIVAEGELNMSDN
jgi:ethanolamine utilization protein EutQ (cupin superfamily)